MCTCVCVCVCIDVYLNGEGPGHHSSEVLHGLLWPLPLIEPRQGTLVLGGGAGERERAEEWGGAGVRGGFGREGRVEGGGERRAGR